jgi:hypothetical protein
MRPYKENYVPLTLMLHGGLETSPIKKITHPGTQHKVFLQNSLFNILFQKNENKRRIRSFHFMSLVVMPQV